MLLLHDGCNRCKHPSGYRNRLLRPPESHSKCLPMMPTCEAARQYPASSSPYSHRRVGCEAGPQNGGVPNISLTLGISGSRRDGTQDWQQDLGAAHCLQEHQQASIWKGEWEWPILAVVVTAATAVVVTLRVKGLRCTGPGDITPATDMSWGIPTP